MGSSLLSGSLFGDGSNLLHFCDVLFLFAETSKLAQLGNNIWVGLQVALGLGFVIFVHELGHFLAAKTFGVRCDKFYIGFDVPLSLGPIKLPSTLGKFQYGETEYGVGIIPLGGYVKMLGQDDDPRKAEEEAAATKIGEGEDAPLDPRSYPAKPVWQRMIIISAGVVMNLIFAVILAGIAFFYGVPYTPTVVGTTYGGGPGWQVGLQAGDQILRVGEMQKDAPKMRYDDFGPAVATHGFEHKDGALPLTVSRGSERLELTAHPTAKYHPKGFYFLGVNAPLTPKFGPEPYRSDSVLAETTPDLQANDVAVAVDGETIPVDERYGVALGSNFTAMLQAKWEKPVKVTLERPGESEEDPVSSVEIELPPVPVRSLGVGFETGPVTAVRENSIAAEAGFAVGDVIKTVNGEDIANGLEIPAVVARLAGQEVTIAVEREVDGQKTLANLTFQNVDVASFDAISSRSGELTIGGVGVAFSVLPIVSSVDDKLVGEDSGISVGDQLKQVQWVPLESEIEELSKYFNAKQAFKPIVIDDAFPVASLYSLLQSIPEGENLRCTFIHEGTVQDPVALKNAYADNWFWHQRGVLLTSLMDIQQTNNPVEAGQLGFWETSRRFKEVLNILKLLFTGQLGLNGLGGPGAIAYAAASEANMGVSRLMLFLTFLSANLAILNFLPIPALDGGHMVFLTAEAIMGKPVNEALQIRLTMAGVLCLLSLMAFVIIKDILWFTT